MSLLYQNQTAASMSLVWVHLNTYIFWN